METVFCMKSIFQKFKQTTFFESDNVSLYKPSMTLCTSSIGAMFFV